MSSEKPADKEEGDARAKAFEKEYNESHPNGPYPPVELKLNPAASREPKDSL